MLHAVICQLEIGDRTTPPQKGFKGFKFVTGKTTFIKNMFASYAQDADLKVNDVSPPTSKDEFINSPEKLCTEIVVSDQTTQTRYHYKVQDTPGYDSMEVYTSQLYLAT